MNDWVGRWVLSYPAFVPYDLYRRSHMAHHHDEIGPNEPDTLLYAGYPITRASLRRKLTRDAFGVSGWKNLKALLVALTEVQRPARGAADRRRFRWSSWPPSGPCRAGRWLYLVLWLLPWMTVLARPQPLAGHRRARRHGPLRGPAATTHVIRQRWLARFWMVPYNTGWHLAHHVDSGIPWRNLPRLHDELVAAGWVTPGLEWRSYLALWRTLGTGRARIV